MRGRARVEKYYSSENVINSKWKNGWTSYFIYNER